MDPKKAGSNWGAFEVGLDGNNITLALPTQPGDKPPSGDGIFLGTAVERYLNTGKSYGGFDGTDAEKFMRQRNGN